MEMFCIYLFCIFLTFVCQVNANEFIQPKLHQKYNNDEIQLECIIYPYNSKFIPSLYCSMDGKEHRFYETCNKIPNLHINASCTKKNENNTLTITYVFDKWSMPTGAYYCKYKAKDSPSFHYTQVRRSTERVFQVTTTIRPVSPTLIRIELIVGLLGVFAFSFILNVAFIIRCCILKRYLVKYPHVSRRTKVSPKWSWVTCFCMKEEIKATDVYYKIKNDPYEKIRNQPSSETSKSKSSIANEYLNRPISQDTERLCFSSTASQISRSSTFAAGLPFIVHTPIDQCSLSAVPPEGFHPFVMPYTTSPDSQTIKQIANPNHRRSSYYIYDEVPGEHIMMNSSTMPIRHFASTGSLQNRPRQLVNNNNNFKSSPLPEEDQMNFSKFNKESANPEEEMGLIVNDCSSVMQDFSSSEETYLSSKDNDSMKDPVRVAKLEMSREMMAKADTLLREAHNLLKMT